MNVSGEAIALIIGGLGSFIGIALTAVKALREGAETRQRNLMADLEEARDRAEHDGRQQAIRARYWEHFAGRVLDAQRRGVDAPEANPPEWVLFEAREKKR